MFVLIVGGRSGEDYVADPNKSVTNAEYLQAVEAKLPIFALVEREVLTQFRLYNDNKENANVDASKISYASVDTIRVFDFISSVRGQATNNALIPFSTFDDIQVYLRQQWASMMFQGLSSRGEERRVASTLQALTEMGQKLEYLTREVLNAVGDKFALASAELYDALQDYVRASAVMGYERFGVTPEDILRSPTVEEFLATKGASIQSKDSIEGPDGEDVTSTYAPAARVFELVYYVARKERQAYADSRERMLRRLKAHRITVEGYLEREAGLQGEELNEGATT